MEFFKHNTTIDFMQLKSKAMALSVILFVLCIVGLWQHGLSLGLDFTGGTQVVLSFNDADKISVPQARSILEKNGIESASIQAYGSSKRIAIKIKPQELSTHPNESKQHLRTIFPKGTIESMEFIGPQVGHNMMINGLLAILISMVATMIYIALRFEMRFAIAAIISLIHDPILILGTFAWFDLEFNLISLAALLTILGYSLNDTIVVYDRVRENFMRQQKAKAYDVVNAAINQTLSRTIMTSSLTLVVVLALYLLGGNTLSGFALALIIGIVIGTYSSIYIAGALSVSLGLTRESLMPKKRITDHLP